MRSISFSYCLLSTCLKASLAALQIGYFQSSGNLEQIPSATSSRPYQHTSHLYMIHPPLLLAVTCKLICPLASRNRRVCQLLPLSPQLHCRRYCICICSFFCHLINLLLYAIMVTQTWRVFSTFFANSFRSHSTSSHPYGIDIFCAMHIVSYMIDTFNPLFPVPCQNTSKALCGV